MASSESISEFAEALQAAAAALSEFEDAVEGATAGATEAGGGDAEASGVAAGARAAGRRGGRGRVERGGRRVAGRAAGVAAAGALESLRFGVNLEEGIKNAVISAFTNISPKLRQTRDAATLAAQRTLDITGPLARFGEDVTQLRQRLFPMEFERAEREVGERQALERATIRKIAAEAVDEGWTRRAPRPGDDPNSVTYEREEGAGGAAGVAGKVAERIDQIGEDIRKLYDWLTGGGSQPPGPLKGGGNK